MSHFKNDCIFLQPYSIHSDRSDKPFTNLIMNSSKLRIPRVHSKVVYKSHNWYEFTFHKSHLRCE